jgi:hypothetical protein
MRRQGCKQRSSFGFDPGVRAKALHPISQRWESVRCWPCQSSWGVLPPFANEPVRLVR